MLERSIDPACEPFREIIADWRADIERTSCFAVAEPKSDGLTSLQSKVLRFIAEYTGQHNKAPSYRDIAEQFGMKSIAQVFWIVRALVTRGRIRRRPGCARSIEVVS